MKKVEIELSDEIYEKVKGLIHYRNHKAFIEPDVRDKTNDWDIEDFISGCVVTYVNEIYELMTLTNYGKLNVHSTIKNKFKDYFNDTDISQREFSRMIGIHQSALSSFISNQRQPSLETFIKIWLGLGCPPISDLLTSE